MPKRTRKTPKEPEAPKADPNWTDTPEGKKWIAERKKPATPQDTADWFTRKATYIRERARGFVYRLDDPELAARYDLERGVLAAMRKFFIEHDTPQANLPDLPPLPGSHFFAGMTNLADYCEDAARRLTAKPKDGGGKGTTWKDAQGRLLVMVENHETYTTLDELAARLDCGKTTVHKAIQKSVKLTHWAKKRAHKSPKAQSINPVVMDNATSKAPDPADVLPDDEVDSRMKLLIAQAKPAERLKLVALDKDGRRRIVMLAQESAEDLYNEDLAPKGNRTLGRKV
jgi:hypothetical protein